MEMQPSQIGEELLCMNAEKVYDWVILQGNVNSTIPVVDLGDLPLDPVGAAISNLTTECFLTDSEGNRLTPNAVVDTSETREREDRPFVIDGSDVTLQNVSFEKTLYVVIEFRGLNGTTPFVIQTVPIPVTIPESLFMCAPNGTDLVVRITSFDCSIRLNTTDATLASIDISLNVCQSIQSVTNVTVELATEFCEPRDILTEQCPSPSIPQQCPELFPG